MDSEATAEQFLQAAARNIDTTFEHATVFPGEDVSSKLRRGSSGAATVKLGSGLVHDSVHESDGISVVSSLYGQLSYRAPSTYWVESKSCKKYTPRIGEQVVGIVGDRAGDYYRVEINSGALALLPRLAFDGATKRNLPELRRGDVVFCKVTSAFKDCDTELTCVSSGAIKDWNSGESMFGALTEGIVVPLTLAHAKGFLNPDSVLLNALGRVLSFEVAIGLNGLVWIKSVNELHTIAIRNAMINSQSLDDVHIEAMVEILLKRIRQIEKSK